MNNNRLNIGFAHCFMCEEKEDELKDILLHSLPTQFDPSKLNVSIFCPLAYQNEITPSEAAQNKIYPVQFTIEVVQKMLVKWQEETHVIIVSNLIYESLREASVNMENIRNINSINNILLLLIMHLKNFFAKAGIDFDDDRFYEEAELIEKTGIFTGKNRLTLT